MTASPAAPTPAAETVLSHLRRQVARLDVGSTVAETLAMLRADPPPPGIVYFYAVDEGGRLRGVVPTRALLLGRPEQRIGEVMDGQLVTLPSTVGVAEARAKLLDHRLLALPVVDPGGRLMGVFEVPVPAEGVEDLHRSDRRDDLFQRIGVHEGGLGATPWAAFRGRFPWLGVNLAGGILSAFLSGIYEQTLARVVALALFIPVVLNMAESVSSQSVSLALHTLGAGPTSWRSLWPKLRAELLVGLLLGLGSGVVVGLVSLAWQRDARLALALLGGIGGGMAASATLGLAVPAALRMLRLDPRVAAGPIALAAADVTTILAYFSLARALLG